MDLGPEDSGDNQGKVPETGLIVIPPETSVIVCPQTTIIAQRKRMPQCDVQIRWMIRRDMPEVLDIEDKSFEFAWTEEDFLCCLRQRNCIGMVAEHQERIVGFMIYELLKSQLHVLNFAVAPWARRRTVGKQMVEKLVGKLSQQRRQEVCLEVRETNLAAQMFFSNQGFQANGVLRGHYDDTEEDAYLMSFSLPGRHSWFLEGIPPMVLADGGFVPKNRIAALLPTDCDDLDDENAA